MDGLPITRKVLAFAVNLRINPAIPAGRIRKEKGDYKVFSKQVREKRFANCLFNNAGVRDRSESICEGNYIPSCLLI